MITSKELIENGFVAIGEYANRIVYNRLGFEVIEHNGTVYREDSEDGIESIEKLNKLYIENTKEYLQSAIVLLQVSLSRINDILNFNY